MSSHAALLEEADLLKPRNRILGGRPFPQGPVYEGLVIDDYFSLSVSKASNPKRSTLPAVACFHAARKKYDHVGVLGSPEKDIVGSHHFKVAGAEVNSSDAALSRGIVTVSAPVQKRLSLAVLSLRSVALPVLSSALATRLAGNWTSVLLYRRCLTCLLSKLYAYGSSAGTDPGDVFLLHRKAADELVLAAVFSFVAASDVTRPVHSELFATDASCGKGAIVARQITQSTAKTPWLTGD